MCAMLFFMSFDYSVVVNMINPVCLSDIEVIAKKKVSSIHWSYLSGGAGDELTMRDNRAAFHR